nr:protein QUIRKY-like [Tanacetum cinerariifolium]
MTSLTSMCEVACQIVQKKLEEKQLEEEQAAKAQNWKLPVCYDDEDDEESSNSLENNIISELPSCVAITPNEPVDSLSIGDEHLNTILATESDEFIKSCVENLVSNPSEFEGESECHVPVGFTTFSNVLFDAAYDSDSSDDQSLSDEDVPEKIYLNPLFDEAIIPMEIDLHSFNAESDLIESMPNHDSSIIISSKIDSLFDEFSGELTIFKSIPPGIDETDCHPEKETRFAKRLLYDNSSPRSPEEIVSDNSNADIESFSPSPIPNEDSGSHMEEIDLPFTLDDPMPPSIEEDDYDSGRDILILEELLDNYSLSLPANESYHFDIPSSYRPPAKPPVGSFEYYCSSQFLDSGVNLWVNVIEGKYLKPTDATRLPKAYVKATLGHQTFRTKISSNSSINPLWNEDLMFVVAEPFDEPLILSLKDKFAPNHNEVLGTCSIRLQDVDRRLDNKAINTRWFYLEKNVINEGEKKEVKFASRIHLRICLEGGYHVVDESTNHSSDLRPTSKHLWRNSIGVLKVGIMRAHWLLPMMTKEGRGTTDAFCVAKYRRKWVRTRTFVSSFTPKWDEHYTWEVFDPCTYITIGVFDNSHLQSGDRDGEALIEGWGRYRPRILVHMDTRRSYADSLHPDDLDEERDTFPTSLPGGDILRMRYDRLRSVSGRLQKVAGDLATQGERIQSLLRWRDPAATTVFVVFCLIAAFVLYATPFYVVIIQIGLYVLRHPRFRSKLPSVPLNFIRRLPARTDSML